jgi:hypothetical protein
MHAPKPHPLDDQSREATQCDMNFAGKEIQPFSRPRAAEGAGVTRLLISNLCPRWLERVST